MKYLWLCINLLATLAFFLILLKINWHKSGGDIALVFEFVVVLLFQFIISFILSLVLLKDNKEILRGIAGIAVGTLISIFILKNIESNNINEVEMISTPLDSLNKLDSNNRH